MEFFESTNYAAACRSLERENQEALAEAQERAKSEGRDPEKCRVQDGREVTHGVCRGKERVLIVFDEAGSVTDEQWEKLAKWRAGREVVRK